MEQTVEETITLKKEKIHPRHIFRITSTERYYIIRRMTKRNSGNRIAAAFHPVVLTIKF